MPVPPFPADQEADARHLVANLGDFLADHDAAALQQMLTTAWAILTANAAHRRRAAAPIAPALPEDAA